MSSGAARGVRVSARVRSPFESRAYGGYTRDQVDFTAALLPSSGAILDPMAGQGFALCELAHAGREVWLGDLNPAPLLLATLRDPATLSRASELADSLRLALRRVQRRRPPGRTGVYCDDWLPAVIRAQLVDLASCLGLDMFVTPLKINGDFWGANANARFGAAIAVLAARHVACFTDSDNVTWLKPGGLIRETDLASAMNRQLRRWEAYARDTLATYPAPGRLHVSRMDCVNGAFAGARRIRAVVTSPPYANRLDYTRLWGPETAVACALSGGGIEQISRELLGTTAVGGGAPRGVEPLPSFIRTALKEIKADPTEYSSTYYYPFFLNYATGLVRACDAVAQALPSGGTAIMFVRDTVRKDVLFATGALITHVFTERHGFDAVATERKVVRQHVGLRRRRSSNGVFGLAQQEWWLAFKKRAVDAGP